ncbi:3'-5' exonuclease [Sphingobacterium suaedae]|uniref:Exonuclease domain-containing protein n=1 Tax=Sphingobacterium suaedae TaxID=1686402 RepID=A0ABW5KCZ5_9SPHI
MDYLNSYLLFIDTETSGIPNRWNRPYMDQQNWPSVIQVAWIVYDNTGVEIKRNSMYIYESDIVIKKESQRIHGIDIDFLKENGFRRKEVLRKLAHDIKKYKPLIIGHFIELDVHVLSADYYRAQLKNPFVHQAFFCTMLDSKKYALNPTVDYLRLIQLYEYVFQITPSEMHEAEHDAHLTAQCFLTLWRRRSISTSDILKQQTLLSSKLNIEDKQNS